MIKAKERNCTLYACCLLKGMNFEISITTFNTIRTCAGFQIRIMYSFCVRSPPVPRPSSTIYTAHFFKSFRYNGQDFGSPDL